MKSFDTRRLDEALNLLSERLELAQSPHYELIVCGGSSLIARGFGSRVTQDVDVVARRGPAALWACAHDVSPEFRQIVRDMLQKLGHASAAAQL